MKSNTGSGGKMHKTKSKTNSKAPFSFGATHHYSFSEKEKGQKGYTTLAKFFFAMALISVYGIYAINLNESEQSFNKILFIDKLVNKKENIENQVNEILNQKRLLSIDLNENTIYFHQIIPSEADINGKFDLNTFKQDLNHFFTFIQINESQDANSTFIFSDSNTLVIQIKPFNALMKQKIYSGANQTKEIAIEQIDSNFNSYIIDLSNENFSGIQWISGPNKQASGINLKILIGKTPDYNYTFTDLNPQALNALKINLVGSKVLDINISDNNLTTKFVNGADLNYNIGIDYANRQENVFAEFELFDLNLNAIDFNALALFK